MRSGRWRVLSSLMIVPLAACGGGVSSEWRSTDQSKPPAVIVTHPPTNGSDEAEVNGRVRYLRIPGCFVLVQGRGEERVRFLIVWPHGSAVRDERGQLVVDVPGFGDVPEGSSIEAGGGYSKDYARLSLPRPRTAEAAVFATLLACMVISDGSRHHRSFWSRCGG